MEELTVGAGGKSLDTEFLRFTLSDPDEHALEQALVLTEEHGGGTRCPAVDDGFRARWEMLCRRG